VRSTCPAPSLPLTRGVLLRSLISISLSLWLLTAGGCSDGSERRTWRATDHGSPPPPPAQLPPPQAASATRPPTPGDPAAALFQVACASCHGASGRGDGAERPGPMVDLRSPEWQAGQEDRAIAEVISLGRGEMPAFRDRIAPEGIAALVTHIRSFGGGEEAQGEEAQGEEAQGEEAQGEEASGAPSAPAP